MKAHVDKKICVGCGLCPEVCPENFQMEEARRSCGIPK